jgi:hypothetical protein
MEVIYLGSNLQRDSVKSTSSSTMLGPYKFSTVSLDDEVVVGGGDYLKDSRARFVAYCRGRRMA